MNNDNLEMLQRVMHTLDISMEELSDNALLLHRIKHNKIDGHYVAYTGLIKMYDKADANMGVMALIIPHYKYERHDGTSRVCVEVVEEFETESGEEGYTRSIFESPATAEAIDQGMEQMMDILGTDMLYMKLIPQTEMMEALTPASGVH